MGPAQWDVGTAIGPCCFWGLGRLEDDAASMNFGSAPNCSVAGPWRKRCSPASQLVWWLFGAGREPPGLTTPLSAAVHRLSLSLSPPHPAGGCSGIPGTMQEQGTAEPYTRILASVAPAELRDLGCLGPGSVPSPEPPWEGLGTGSGSRDLPQLHALGLPPQCHD